jgi:hypothetical protein
MFLFRTTTTTTATATATATTTTSTMTMTMTMTHGKIVLPLALALLLVVFVAWNNVDHASPSLYASPRELQENEHLSNIQDDTADLQALSEKLTPKKFLMDDSNEVLLPNQFVHLHHMKTAGTSMDQLLRCGMDRYQDVQSVDIPYTSLHECSKSRYDKCLSGDDQSCKSRIQKAAFMSYCAPLKDLPTFGWNNQEVQAVTVLRNPVDRVWSMFRFQTKHCYQCKPLLEVYNDIDTNQPVSDQLCIDQLMNHQAANLLNTEWDANADPLILADQAIDNMKNFFTLIGLTEELSDTVDMVGQVFPWMNETIAGSDRACTLSHANASPKNNRCGPSGTHWDLADHPDNETRAAIVAHNQMDIKLYEAAVQHFEHQKLALLMQKEGL